MTGCPPAFFQILLVILLGAVELSGRGNLGNYRVAIDGARGQLVFQVLKTWNGENIGQKVVFPIQKDADLL